MQSKQYTLLCLFFALATTIFAQQLGNYDGSCGTIGKTPWMQQYQQHRSTAVQSRDVDTAMLYVPVTFQITGKDSGSGYFLLERAIQRLCEMNDQYKDAYIHFYLMPGDPVRYLNNSAWHNHPTFSGGAELIDNNRIPGRLNAFIVANPAGNCGYAWKDAIVLGSNCSASGNSTWAHEAGHHLSLPHPFLGWEGITWNYAAPAPETVGNEVVERTDSSNCNYAGDGFCDTPPDYLNYRWSCNGDKKSFVIQTDPDSSTFQSDATLIMGYSLDECAARFTPEQIVAMRANLRDEHLVYTQQATQPGVLIDDAATVQLNSPIDSQLVHFQNFDVSWEPLPNASFYTVVISFQPDMSPVIFTQTLYNTTHLTVNGGIPNNRLMYWQVRAYSEWDLCNPNTNLPVGVFKTKNLTATNELEQILVAELSPNPVNEGTPARFNIVTDEKMDAVLRVTDARGRICQSQQVRIAAGDNFLEIPTDGLSAGMYFVALQNEKGQVTKRLVVMQR